MYFKNLDGFRFIASVFVIIGHCDHILQNDKHIRAYSPYSDKLASFGVDFFYVLSGFLIHFLLFEELRKTGTIQIKNFYIRRALRLWPLYFLVGTVGLVTAEPILRWFGLVDRSPTPTEFWSNLGYLYTFSINFQILLGKMNPFSSPVLGHFWSLSVEEQFYLLCAPGLLFFRKYTWIFVAYLIGLGYMTTIYPPDIFNTWFETNAVHAPYFFTTTRFFNFGLGAALAWLVSNRLILSSICRFFEENIAKLLSKNNASLLFKGASWAIQLPVFLYFCRYLFGNHYCQTQEERIVNALWGAGIIASGIVPYSIFFLEINWVKYLGKISFGIYIYHIFAIRLTFKLLDDFGMPLGTTYYLLLPFISMLIAIGISVVSFEWIEKPILAFRKRF
jgi:peptidoglycan/LPS O-acetylase OafA/YrhL